MTNKFRWGILGTGIIAHEFAQALTLLPDAELVAVGSRRQETADAFANQYDILGRYPSYEALVEDDSVDIVYVATPHLFHFRDTKLCLEAGKHALVEKAFTINATEAQALIELAQRNQLFMMEAMWTRFFPITVRLRELIADGAIGDVRVIRADLSHRFGFDPKHRLFDPEKGGGALLDLGVYSISLSSMILGKPESKVGIAHIGMSGVDDQSAYLLSHQSGAIAVLSASLNSDVPREAVISGTRGSIEIHGRWQQPGSMTLTVDGSQQLIEMPFEGSGYHYQAIEVMECIRANRLHSQIMPLAETLEIMRTMDNLREPWNLVYPGET